MKAEAAVWRGTVSSSAEVCGASPEGASSVPASQVVPSSAASGGATARWDHR